MRGALVCQWIHVAVVLFGRAPVSAQKTLVRFGYFSESMPLGVACARNWLDTEDFEVACFPQSSGSYAVSRLDQGDLDASLLGSTPAAISNSRGVRAIIFQMAQGHGSSQGLAVRGIHGPLELMGKCLASPFGSTAHYHLLFLLHTLEMPICPSSLTCDEVSPSCVTVVNMSPSGLMAAWDVEGIDGAFIWGEGFLHLKATGGTVVLDSDDLKSWGQETFIVVAARENFAEEFPGLLEHIARVKLVLDDSWLLSDAAWEASRTGNETLLASLSHFLSKARPREVEAWKVAEIHHDMGTKEIFSTQTQLGCLYLGHPSRCPRSNAHPVCGLAKAIEQTSMFFMEQKGLATIVPSGEHFDEDPASYFDEMIDSSVLFTANGLQAVTLDTLTANTGSIAIPSTSSVETGSCGLGGTILSPTGNAVLGSFSDKPGVNLVDTPGASYENNMHCMFRIPPATGNTVLVELTFAWFRVWSGDTVRVYEGDVVSNVTTGKLLAQLQGIDPVIPPIRSPGPIILEFITDQNTEECYNMPQADGWIVRFDRSHPGCTDDGSCVHGNCVQELMLGQLRNVCACLPGWAGADCSFSGCLGTVIARTPTGTFRSGASSLQSDHRYENSAACIFEVHTHEATVNFEIEMDLEDTFDWLEVRAGTGTGAIVHARLTGYRTLTVRVPTIDGIASLHYTTDDKGRRSGFIADYTTSSPRCQTLCSSSHGTCEGSTCKCAPGWAGIDCTLPFCAPGPLRYIYKSSGVIRSNHDTASIPAMANCRFETETLSTAVDRERGKHVGTRLLVHKFDLEPDSVGDLVTVSYDSTVLSLRVERCTNNADCTHSWQAGECVPLSSYDYQVCKLRTSIDVLTTSRLQVHIQTDRNDITAPNRQGVSMTWHAIAACPTDGRTAWECVGPPGSCDCEVNGGTCSVDSVCECPSGHCACGCGGHVAQPPYWILALFAGILICVGTAGYLKRRHSKEKNKRRREEAKKDAAHAMAKALVAQAKTLELEKNHMSYPDEWELDPQNTVTIDDDNDKRTVQLPIDGLVPVPETSAEYWDVYDRLTRPPDATVANTDHVSDKRGMHDAWITQLHRIQNPDLYTYFMNQKARLKSSNGPDHNGRPRPESMNAFDGHPTEGNPLGNLREVMGWHGTGTFPAENIYTDRQDGFMMQFASPGQWGRGLYFAAEAGYSAYYATKASSLQPDIRDSKSMRKDECELLLATLLIGNTVEMDRDRDRAMCKACHELKTAPAVAGCQVVPAVSDGMDACIAPPVPGPPGGLKYNTVTGFTQTDRQLPDQSWMKNPGCPRSRVWNPKYLVRYYRGKFDRTRVQFQTRAEAGAPDAAVSGQPVQAQVSLAVRQATGAARPPPPPRPVDYQWKCEAEDGSTVDYPPSITCALEEAFNNSVKLLEYVWLDMTYIVDLDASTQTNRSTGVQRRMVRHVNGQPSGWVTMLDLNSGRYYYTDRYQPEQPATWSRTPGCPSEPFGGAGTQQQVQANPLHATQSAV